MFILSSKKKININPSLNVSKKVKKPRIRAMYRIGPHDKDVLSVLICGMLGD